MTAAYAFYAVEGSYYAAKTRSQFLRKGIPFNEILADRRAFAEVIVPRVGYPVVPVVITPDDEVLQDTAEIFDALEARHPEPAMLPATPVRRFAARVMELFADEWLKVPALHYRWYYDHAFAARMMGENNDPSASPDEQRRVGKKIAAGFSSWPRHLGVSDATRAAVEAGFLECLELLDAHFREHDFAFGSAPCLADCALMGPLYAHLYRDPHSGAIVRAEAPAVCEWIARMRAPRVADAPRDPTGPDVVPPTMLRVFGHLARDYVPVLETALPLFGQWLARHPDDPIPRYAGEHPCTFGRGKPYAAAGERSIHPFELWKAQRVCDVYAAAPPESQAALERFCADIGACGLLRLDFPRRLVRRHYRLERA